MGNKLSHLNENQTAFFTQKGNSYLEKLDLFGQTFDNVHNLKEVNFPEVVNTYNPAVLVVSNQEVLNNIETIFTKNKVFHQTSLISYADLSQKEIKSLAHFGGESEVVHEDANGNSILADEQPRSEKSHQFTNFTGFLHAVRTSNPTFCGGLGYVKTNVAYFRCDKLKHDLHREWFDHCHLNPRLFHDLQNH